MMLQSFRMAFSAIAANKMRSFLTMLGVIIGIMAVVTLVSIVDSATNNVLGELQSVGADKISVSTMDMRGRTFTMTEIDEIVEKYDAIASIAPSTVGNSTVKAGDKSERTQITGVTPSYFSVENLDMQYGRMVKSPDVDNNSHVCVLGPKIANDLFGTDAAVGMNLSIDGYSFLVVGVMEDAGSSLMGSTNTSILIPYTLAQRMYNTKGVDTFTLRAADSNVVSAAEINIKEELYAKFRDEDAYMVFNQSTLLDSFDSVMSTMSLMMGGIGGISLLVGGIGIMNIMLVSVAERTREIGIRKAIGASRRRILSQFLIEALVLSVVGGLIGLVVSWLAISGLSAFINANYGSSAGTYAMSGGAALLAIVFSLAIGLVFGIYPANKAAKMSPIEALRTE